MANNHKNLKRQLRREAQRVSDNEPCLECGFPGLRPVMIYGYAADGEDPGPCETCRQRVRATGQEPTIISGPLPEGYTAE